LLGGSLPCLADCPTIWGAHADAIYSSHTCGRAAGRRGRGARPAIRHARSPCRNRPAHCGDAAELNRMDKDLKLLTLARDLRRRKARERRQSFVVEGVRAVTELVHSPLVVRGLLVSPDLAANDRAQSLRIAAAARGIEIAEVTAHDFESAAETESPQGVLAIADIPVRSWESVVIADSMRVLLLDAVQDPGNVGTMLRTAAALGVSATAALPGTVDLWNAKVVRSGMGTHFTHAAFSSTWDELDRWRSSHGVALWGADPQGTPLADAAHPAPSRLALAVGNEGAGLTEECRRRADRLVALPIAHVESLNVAVAASILLYELRA
jgi:RNA methyltransferase, TrmH family